MNGENTPGGEIEPKNATAETVYKVLNELGTMVQGILEQQISINEKLVDNPGASEEKKSVEVDTPPNPRHFAGFRDMGRSTIRKLINIQRLQQHLLKHL